MAAEWCVHLAEHLVGRRVAELLHGGQDELALGRQPVAAAPEPGAEILPLDVLVGLVAFVGAHAGPPARWSRAHRWGWISCPIAAMS